MPELQESDVGGDDGAGAQGAGSAQGLFENHREMIWSRSDWARPVGWLPEINTDLRRSEVRGLQFHWYRVDVPLLRLSHNAALLMLQGKRLGEVLIPNHSVRVPDTERPGVPVAHVLLRVDPWEYWRSVPTLTGLVLARLGELPAGLGSAEVLAALAQDSAA